MKITREQPPMWAEPILMARHKSCEVHLAYFPKLKELNIQFIWSKNEGKGEASETIRRLIKYCDKKGWKLVSSIPINSAWEHLCQKFNLKVYRKDS